MSSSFNPFKKKKTNEQSANYIEELKKVEVARAVRLEKEQEVTQ